MNDIVCPCMVDALEWRQIGEVSREKPKTRQEALDRLKTGEIARQGDLPTLPRNRREALKLGWSENEFGFRCPSCTEAERKQALLDEEEGATDDINEFLAQLGL